MDKLPAFSEDLVKELSKTFPDAYAIPTTSTPEREIWIKVGTRRIVSLLERLLEESKSVDPTQKIIPINKE